MDARTRIRAISNANEDGVVIDNQRLRQMKPILLMLARREQIKTKGTHCIIKTCSRALRGLKECPIELGIASGGHAAGKAGGSMGIKSTLRRDQVQAAALKAIE